MTEREKLSCTVCQYYSPAMNGIDGICQLAPMTMPAGPGYGCHLGKTKESAESPWLDGPENDGDGFGA